MNYTIKIINLYLKYRNKNEFGCDILKTCLIREKSDNIYDYLLLTCKLKQSIVKYAVLIDKKDFLNFERKLKLKQIT